MNKTRTNRNAQPYSLTIGWLYPELMSTYGDRGNIIVLTKRCQWRNIDVLVKKLDVGFDYKQLATCDLLFMGGAQDLQQTIVATDMKGNKTKQLKTLIQESIPGLYICGAYQFLGNYYKEADGTVIDGLGILDLHTENPGRNYRRLIGNIVITSNFSTLHSHHDTFVGFENHGGRTYLGKEVQPLGTVKTGFGNNGQDKTEGAVYKNSFGSYLHGPMLPKNPHFADFLIKLALDKKYKEDIMLDPLDDTLEMEAHQAIVKRLGK